MRYLLEGNIRRVGNDLRVTAQLVEAESDNILWTQKFDRPIAELAGLQDALVSEVAAHLRVQVERAEIEHALKKPENASAWESVMRAWAHLGTATRAGYEAAARRSSGASKSIPTMAAPMQGWRLSKAISCIFVEVIVAKRRRRSPATSSELARSIPTARRWIPA